MSNEGIAVAFNAAVELIEFRVLAVGLGVNGRSLAVTTTPYLFRFGVGAGQNLLAFAVGLGPDAFTFGKAGCAQAVGFLLALGFHPALHRLGNLGGKVNAAPTHVEIGR